MEEALPDSPALAHHVSEHVGRHSAVSGVFYEGVDDSEHHLVEEFDIALQEFLHNITIELVKRDRYK